MSVPSSFRFPAFHVSWSLVACSFMAAALNPLQAQTGAGSDSFSFQASASDTKEVGEIILRFSAPITEIGRTTSPEPDHPVKEVVRYKGSLGKMEVSVNTVEFNPIVAVDLAGAAAGSVKSVTALQGITEPKSSVNDAVISGCPAKTVSFTASRYGRSLCVESLYIQKGQQMLTVMVTFPGTEPGLKEKAAEIIGSVRVKGGK